MCLQIWSDGTILQGWHLDDSWQHARIIWPNESIYEGQMSTGAVPHGRGSFKSPQGLTYKGGFKQGRFNGRGVTTRPSGEKHIGWYKRGKLSERKVEAKPNRNNSQSKKT